MPLTVIQFWALDLFAFEVLPLPLLSKSREQIAKATWTVVPDAEPSEIEEAVRSLVRESLLEVNSEAISGKKYCSVTQAGFEVWEQCSVPDWSLFLKVDGFHHSSTLSIESPSWITVLNEARYQRWFHLIEHDEKTCLSSIKKLTKWSPSIWKTFDTAYSIEITVPQGSRDAKEMVRRFSENHQISEHAMWRRWRMFGFGTDSFCQLVDSNGNAQSKFTSIWESRRGKKNG